ncbi:MAG: hypothetical protein KDA87_16000 [Planctomycetales bacterium]|nr:hypothetical protein [Planctomycetales bacterium]
MKSLFSWATAVVLLSGSVSWADTIIQNPGTDFLVVEAEAFDVDDFNDPFGGWIVISPDDPQEVELHNSNPGVLLVPPEDSNPSGNLAIFDQEGGGDFSDVLTYSLQFDTPGDYFLYIRYSLFEMRDIISGNYGHEDSIYVPVEFLEQDPTEQTLRDTRDGFIPFSSLGATPADGCRIDEDPWRLSLEECEAEGLLGEVRMEGQYHWNTPNWNNDLGQVFYGVEDTGVALDFSIASRERGTSIDVFVFSQNPSLTEEELDALIAGGGVTSDPGDFDANGSLELADINLLAGAIQSNSNPASFDLTEDGLVNSDDLNSWIVDLKNTWIGDANLDGEFNSSDFVAVFTAGKFEQELDATWDEGDWTGDGRFNSSDFVAAFTDGGFEIGPRGGVAAVPEPSSPFLPAILLLACWYCVRRR